MEFIIEFVIEILFEFVLEFLVDTGWRTISSPAREALGLREPRRAQRLIGVALAALVAIALGWWRGVTVGGLGWGWWFALVVTAVATSATIYRGYRPAGPRPARGAQLRWWPAGRCRWFAIGNGVFVVTYAIAAGISGGR